MLSNLKFVCERGFVMINPLRVEVRQVPWQGETGRHLRTVHLHLSLFPSASLFVFINNPLTREAKASNNIPPSLDMEMAAPGLSAGGLIST